MSRSQLKTSDALLINRTILRGPEMALLHEHLSRRPATRAELRRRFVPQDRGSQPGRDDTLNNALDALRSLGLVLVLADDSEERFLAAPLSDTAPTFPHAALRALRAMPPRQGVFMALYGWCIRTGRLVITEEELLNVARQHVPSIAAWNAAKISFWAHLGSYLGIVIQLTQRTLLIAPPAARLLEWLQPLLSDQQGWAAAVFDEIDRELAPCYTDQRQLHPGWSATLSALRQQGSVSLWLGSDPPAILRARLADGTDWSSIKLGQRLTMDRPMEMGAPR